MCEHELIMGVLKKSLHTWQRKAASTGPSCVTGVCSQSDGSATSKVVSIESFASGDVAGLKLRCNDLRLFSSRTRARAIEASCRVRRHRRVPYLSKVICLRIRAV